MDSLTHLAAGALTPLLFRKTPRRAAVIAFGIAAGQLPDMDVFFGSGTEALLALHRGITHALAWQPVQILVVVIPFYIWLYCRRARVFPLPAPAGPRPAGGGPAFFAGTQGMGGFTFGRMCLIALLIAFTHIYLDCMTMFGTMALLPFSPVRVAAPAMFIIDPLLSVPLLILLVLALRRSPDIIPPAAGAASGFAFVPAGARKLARVGLAWVVLYPLLCLGVNAAATAALGPSLAAESALSSTQVPARPGSRLRLLTEPFSPFVWKAVVDDGETYRMSTLFLFKASDAQSGRPEYVFAKPDPNLYASLERRHPLFGLFREFAPLMVQTRRPAGPSVQSGYQDAVTEYGFADLRYIASPRSPARWAGRSDPMFILEARVNSSGDLLAYRFLKRGNEAEETPWTIAGQASGPEPRVPEPYHDGPTGRHVTGSLIPPLCSVAAACGKAALIAENVRQGHHQLSGPGGQDKFRAGQGDASVPFAPALPKHPVV